MDRSTPDAVRRRLQLIWKGITMGIFDFLKPKEKSNQVSASAVDENFEPNKTLIEALAWSAEEHPEKSQTIHTELLKSFLLLPTTGPISPTDKVILSPRLEIPGNDKKFFPVFTDLTALQKWNPDWKWHVAMPAREIAKNAWDNGNDEIWINPPGPNGDWKPTSISRRLMQLLATGQSLEADPIVASQRTSPLFETLKKLTDGQRSCEWKFLNQFLNDDVHLATQPEVPGVGPRPLLVPLKPPLSGVGFAVFSDPPAAFAWVKVSNSPWSQKLYGMPGREVIKQAIANKVPALILNPAGPFYEFSAPTFEPLLKGFWPFPLSIDLFHPPEEPNAKNAFLKNLASTELVLGVKENGEWLKFSSSEINGGIVAVFTTMEIYNESIMKDQPCVRVQGSAVFERLLQDEDHLLLIDPIKNAMSIPAKLIGEFVSNNRRQ
jgi:hypothetical protein